MSLVCVLVIEIGYGRTIHLKGLNQFMDKELMHHFSSRDFF